MLQLGAPRLRGRAPLGSTWQVGLARTEVPSPQPFQELGGPRGSQTTPWAWLHLSGSPGDEEGQGWLDHGRVSGLGVGKIIRAICLGLSDRNWTVHSALLIWPVL